MLAKEKIIDMLTQNLISLMEKRQIGVRELARECELSAMTISRICRGAQMPSLDVALRIAEYFEVSVEDLAEKKLS